MRAAFQLLLVAAILLGCVAQANEAVPTKAGVVNYAAGKVLLDSQEVAVKGNVFPRVQANQVIQTADRPVEILLGPGNVLRLGENSAVRMISDRFEDTRLELVKGSAVVECLEVPSGSRVTFAYRKATVTLLKSGFYRLDAEPAQLSVYDGEARVEIGGQPETVAKARRLTLKGGSKAEELRAGTADSLVRWAQQRSGVLAKVNKPAAQSLQYISGSAWIFSEKCGCYTFVPDRWSFRSFWGFTYWSPYAVSPQAADPYAWHKAFDARGDQTQQAPPPQ